MSITAIPNQPIAFNSTDLRNVTCPGPVEELLFTPDDEAVAQFLVDACDPVEQLASPNFEDPDDWYSTSWDIRPNDACITAGTGTINDSSFSPTAGLPYIITVIVTSLLRPKELEVTLNNDIQAIFKWNHKTQEWEVEQ